MISFFRRIVLNVSSYVILQILVCFASLLVDVQRRQVRFTPAHQKKSDDQAFSRPDEHVDKFTFCSENVQMQLQVFRVVVARLFVCSGVQHRVCQQRAC